MPLTIVRSDDNHTLWKACVDSFLDEVGSEAGPGAFASYLWIRNRAQRDLLLEAAEARGSVGWLDPPFCYLGDLPGPKRFALPRRTVGLLTRRRLVARIAQTHARANGIIGPDHGSGVVRGHMLDRMIGELLPSGITPEALELALAQVASDDFARRRNAWVTGVYRDYLAELATLGLYDFRETNALLAERVEAGGLRKAIGGAMRLHVYGLHTPRDRVRLLQSLHAQPEVAVRVYVPAEPEPGEWDELGVAMERVRGGGGRRTRVVQPVPNPRRELGWIAQQVKETLLAGGIEPHQIAIVARTGREDVRRAYDALTEVGVDATARIRTPLAEIPALRAILELFHGVGRGWDYRALRSVLSSPYFALGVDLRWVDYIAARRRPAALADWRAALEILIARKRAPESDGRDWQAERDLRSLRVPLERLEQDLEVLDRLAEKVEPLARARAEADWVALALELVHHGWFGFRRNLSLAPDQRFDVVRLDQRGLTHLEELLREWARLDLDTASLHPADWYTLFRRLLESHELALATPLQKGVQVLEAHDAALTPYDRVFLLHANDGIFPARPTGGGVITDAERERLRAAGVTLDDHERELRRERTLWRAVSANPSVAATYRTTDAGGTPLLPSLMTFELVPAGMHAEELPRSFDPLGDPLSPDQAHLRAARDLADAMQAGADAQASGSANAREGARTRIRTIDPYVLQHALLNAYAEQERGARGNRWAYVAPPPGPWNGEVTHPQALAGVRARFDDERAWSPSQLEQYARSPFLFLLGRVLYLSGLEEADEDTSALIAGSISHEVLQLFYQSYAGGSRPLALEGETLERLRTLSARVIEQRLSKGEWLGTPALWEVRRAAIARQLEEYLVWELEDGFEGDDCPVLCEHELGGSAPVVIEHRALDGLVRSLRVRGRIDRVDRCAAPSGANWRVVDYKSTVIPGKIDFMRGVALQGPLYMKALAVSEGMDVGFAVYRSLKRHEETRIAWGSKQFEAALRIAVSIPERVRAGVFDVALAPRQDWRDYDPGIEIRRSSAVLEDGIRFDV